MTHIIEAPLESIQADALHAQPRVCRSAELLTACVAEMAQAHAAQLARRPPGPVTGFPTLDKEFGGTLAPGVHLVHATPGVGKTAFVLQVAAQCQCPALFLTCEMSPTELLRRQTARVTQTVLGRLKSGMYSPEQVTLLLQRALAATPQLTFLDATQAYATPEWIVAQARERKGDAPYLLLVIDSLHSWAAKAPGAEREYDAFNWSIAQVQQLAAMLNCPVVAVAERSRDYPRYGIFSAWAGIRKMEYGAESVLSLEAGQPDDGRGETLVTLTLAKNRHGVAGNHVDFNFHGALQRFKEVGSGRG